jgi:hypothetical protein
MAAMRDAAALYLPRRIRYLCRHEFSRIIAAIFARLVA